ncbi:thiamine pyrophosphate-binding protein [Mycobacterium sp. ACS4331]|uniref:thiamine pyrophosphate-binding protein n=1 Tax=Mycobacterium sp. ACS4331 TaxID=1834121 RepID=UPI0008023661|nr:thiamine pyrophosphate-binding protein [Mycobacterium sp. ACS4331]OBF25095.1 acetolactate synthase [Mycobacterium sp. ACS4331]
MTSHTVPDTAANAFPRVADEIVEALAHSGITHVFGVGGANIEDVYDALEARPEITGVLAKHEAAAANMADGYARAGAPFGVVLATSGGGSLNLVPALGESFTSRVPVLALVGQAPIAMDGRGSFQDTSGRGGSLNAEALFAQVSVYCRRIESSAQIHTALSDAIAAARTGGPAVLLLPKDIQQARTHRDRRRPRPIQPPGGHVDPRLIAHAIDTGPVTIIVGDQVARDDARDAVERLRAALGARIAAAPDAKDCVEHRGADWVGVTGVMGHPGVADAVDAAALCLLIGTRLPATASAGLQQALSRTRTLSIGSARPFVEAVHFHSDDLHTTLTELADILGHSRSRQAPAAPPTRLSPPPYDGPGIRYADAVTALDQHLADGVDIVADAGNTGAAAIHDLPVRPGGRFLVALGMGGMGYSFGASIGVACWRRRPTVVIAGDGSFFMHGMEIHTAVEHRLPITFVLFNNNAHAMCVTREQLFYGGDYTYNRFRPSRLAAGLAAMFPTLPATEVSDLPALHEALHRACHTRGPSVISIDCSADEIPPFAPFLGAAHQRPPTSSEQREVPNHVAARA